VKLLARAAALTAVVCSAVPTVAALADGVAPSGYRVAVQASVFQFTYDFPTANFHPQADSELTYAEVDGDPSRAHALSSVMWPGAAGGNFGSLLGVLAPPGVPPPPNSVLAALNDPVRAEAATGATTEQETTAPSGTAMKVSVVPESGAITQESRSLTTSAGLSLGPSGSLGASSAAAKHTLDRDGKLVARGQSFVSNVDFGGTFHAGSIATSATEQSVSGKTPTGSSAITVHDLVIGGQKAYVDSAGVHMGEPGKPAGPTAIDAVGKALVGAGMQIYFTSPQKVTIGGVSYVYSASILVYWAPPGDSNGDVFTFSLGGDAVGMVVSPGLATRPGGIEGVVGGAGAPLPAPTLATPGAVAASPASPVLQLPVPATGSGATPGAVSGGGSESLAAGQPASASAPAGIEGWWLVLLAIAALAGIALLPRLPALLTTAAAPDCLRERPSPNRRP
jgi:hypothetical protein